MGLFERAASVEEVAALRAEPRIPEIMYHPQSGWFDEGPQRGPATEWKGLKAL
jgi:hypothetical protein